MATRGDLYIAYGHLLNLCNNDKYLVVGCVKIQGDVIDFAPNFSDDPKCYSLACGIIDGKPVFYGDTVYDSNTGEKIVLSGEPLTFLNSTHNYTFTPISFKENEIVAVRDRNEDTWNYRHYHARGNKTLRYFCHSIEYNPITSYSSSVKVPWNFCRKLTQHEKESFSVNLGIDI